MTKQVNSTENPLIKKVVQLHSSKHRSKHQEFIAEGFRAISTLIAANSKLITLFTTQEFLYDAQQIAPAPSIVVVPEYVMDKMSTAKNPSGLLAMFAIPEQPSFDDLSSGIVLAQVADPGNMGALIRTAVAMNNKTVVCIETVDPWNPKVVQATAGTLSSVNIFCITWEELLLNKKNISLCALVADEGKNPNTVNLKDALIVVGNEGAGIPAAWLAQCDEKITLPMPGKSESLNAAVAGSIAMYLAATQ